MTAPTSAALQHPVQPVATAGNDLNQVFHIAPRASAVTSVTYTPSATITGAATNTRSVSLVNLGQNGAGATVVATLQFNNGVNAPVGVPKTIPLSGTPANLQLAAGDVLQWQSTHVGTGIVDPGGLVSVASSANYA
jgi:hypothetical protein